MRILVTGAAGLIGSQASKHYINKGYQVFGIENNMRKLFFGDRGDVGRQLSALNTYSNFTHMNIDIRDREFVDAGIRRVKPDVIIHTAAQPSHDKAAEIPHLDFETNAVGTLNLLESTRKYCPKSIFIHISTNKVYGDRPNTVPLVEKDTRYDFSENIGDYLGVSHKGFSEVLSIDNSMHSLFGVSKLAADILAQEYGRYFGMSVGIFRGGCLTGPQHAGVELHGFLSYIIKCAVHGKPYTVFGYKGKQVRDQIHCHDVVSCFDYFIESPKKGEVYNLGGGRKNSASVLETIGLIHEKSGKTLDYSIVKENRKGDHICYITDMTKFMDHYPGWKKDYDLENIVEELIEYEVNK